jgi:hypothetical protein
MPEEGKDSHQAGPLHGVAAVYELKVRSQKSGVDYEGFTV